MNSIQFVLFDMDGLMLDTERLSFRSWRGAIERVGYKLPWEIFRQMLGTNLQAILRLLRTEYGPDFPLDEVFDHRYDGMDEAIRTEGVPVKPGLYALLDTLDRLSLRRAVCTSTERKRALRELQGARVLGRFDFVVAGDEVHRSKPFPDIFLRGAERAGVPPEHCAVLEDSEAGILAAHRAGMVPLMVPDLVEPSSEIQKLYARRFADLNEAARFFEQEAGAPGQTKTADRAS